MLSESCATNRYGCYRTGPKTCQVGINVATNACKFTEAGSISLAAHKQAVDSGEGVRIEVIDTGIGMEHEIIERLFEPFM